MMKNVPVVITVFKKRVKNLRKFPDFEAGTGERILRNFPTLLDVSPMKTVIMDTSVYERSVSLNASSTVIAH